MQSLRFVFGLPALSLWDVATGREVLRIKGVNATVYHVAFSPDGRTLATGSSDSEVRLYEVATGKQRATLRGHDNSVAALAFSPDGTLLISGSHDATLLVWDVTGLRRDGQSAELKRSHLESLWGDLADDNAPKAYRAIRTLSVAPKQAVALLKEQLQPVAWDEARITELMRDLDDNSFAKREAASKDLRKMRNEVRPALRKALEQNLSAEVRRRIGVLLERMEEQTRLGLSVQQMRQVRAVEALELIATPEACDLLKKLAAGAAEARLTQEAKAALERLAKREKHPAK